MKKILFLLFLGLFSLSMHAQIKNVISNDNEGSISVQELINGLKQYGHFKFKDVPINGTLTQFVAKLKQQGFTLLKTTESDAILQGKFTGEDVHILVQASSGNVYSVTVAYEEKTTWMALKKDYLNKKRMLTEKYGPPDESIEEFNYPYFEGSGSELLALEEDECTFISYFRTESGNGMIIAKISATGSVALNYVDIMNYLKVSSDAIDDL